MNQSLLSPDIFDKVKYFENQVNKLYPTEINESTKSHKTYKNRVKQGYKELEELSGVSKIQRRKDKQNKHFTSKHQEIKKRNLAEDIYEILNSELHSNRVNGPLRPYNDYVEVSAVNLTRDFSIASIMWYIPKEVEKTAKAYDMKYYGVTDGTIQQKLDSFNRLKKYNRKFKVDFNALNERERFAYSSTYQQRKLSPVELAAAEVLEKIKPGLRYTLSQLLVLRRVPQLRFFYDVSVEREIITQKLMKALNLNVAKPY